MINTTMIGSNPSPVYTITSTDTTTIPNSAGLYWGMNGTSNITIQEPNLNGATLEVKGNANFEGNVKIKGKDLAEMFDKIESRLAILHPNPELEDKWDELKELGKRYKELEAEIIEKEKVWGILKK